MKVAKLITRIHRYNRISSIMVYNLRCIPFFWICEKICTDFKINVILQILDPDGILTVEHSKLRLNPTKQWPSIKLLFFYCDAIWVTCMNKYMIDVGLDTGALLTPVLYRICLFYKTPLLVESFARNGDLKVLLSVPI